MKQPPSLTTEERTTLVSEAHKWLGTPYKKVGLDRDGINCSFFPAAIVGALITSNPSFPAACPPLCDWWFLNSAIMPREQLQPGDWIFFRPREGRPFGRLATHMGVYIGNCEIIHASGKAGAVMKNKLSDFRNSILIERKDPEEIRQWRLENGIP